MSTTYDPKNLLAPRPPMGWNSYNAFGGMHGLPDDADTSLPGGVALCERVILATADAIVESGLRDAGYVYVNIDDRWQDPVRPRDENGHLRHDVRRFPRGMKAVGDYVHQRGLKFGLYTVANVVACGGEEGDGPGGIPRTGSLGHEYDDARSFAQWGVDFLKIDWCGVDCAGNRGRAAEIFSTWNQAIAAAGRGIVLSASTWGEEREDEWAPGLCHMWRTTEDLHATWESVLATAAANADPRWSRVCGPTTGWNDPDMMHVGHPALTPAESRTHLVLWAMMSAPLLAGHDVRTQSEEIRALLSCEDIITLDQDLSSPATVEHLNGWDHWQRQLSDGRMAHAVVNLSADPQGLPTGLHHGGVVVLPGQESEDGQSSALSGAKFVAGHDVRLTMS